MTPLQPSAVRLIAATFFLQPIALGNWLARIPEIRDVLQVDPAGLALALLGAPLGIVATLPFAGPLVARLGGRTAILVSYCLYLPLIALPGLATSGVWLFAALAAVGSAMSILELGLNVEADRIEAASGRLIMSTCHGFWSLGLTFGTLAGGGLALMGVPVAAALSGVALAVLPLCLVTAWALPDLHDPGTGGQSSAFFWPDWPLVGICTYVFGVAMTEGAAADWSGILLRDAFEVPNDVAAFAFAPFAGMVAAGRFFGDTLRGRLGRVVAARSAGVLALVGATLVVAAPRADVAICGLALLGVGVSTGFPLSVTAAAGLGQRSPAANVAFLSMIALGGFLVGPPLIGGVTQHAGIQVGLGMVIPGLLVSLICTGALRPATPRARAAASRPA